MEIFILTITSNSLHKHGSLWMTSGYAVDLSVADVQITITDELLREIAQLLHIESMFMYNTQFMSGCHQS